jgi:N-acyl-D-aspartate/D-glutamate deacylase
VVDGSGRVPYRADVGLRGDRIAAVEGLLDLPGVPRLDAAGRVVAPGFIDLHSHADLCYTLPLARQAALLEGRVRQGITTDLVGNCGIGCVPVNDGTRAAISRICGFIAPDEVDWEWEGMDSYLGRLERAGVLINVATLVAHGPARAAVLGTRASRAAAGERSAIEAVVHEAIEAGAFGVSFGLIYPPGQYADTEELVGVARAARAAGGFAAFHQRGSSRATLLHAVGEIVEVGRRAGATVHHSHVETVGPRAWPGTVEVLGLHQRARREGIDLTGDVIPYTAVCTTLVALFPPWSLDGGIEAFVGRLRDPGERARMRDEVAAKDAAWPPWEEPGRFAMNIARECGWRRIRLAHVDGAANKRFEGLSLEEIGRRREREPFEALCDLLIEERGVGTQLIFGISGDDHGDADLEPLIADPGLALVTDAWEIGKGFPHPGAYGAFPRVLGHYVRERRLLALEEAVRKMTSLPAARLGLADRGLVRAGYKADLVVFDPDTVAARSDYGEPRRAPAGIEHVFVNGRHVVEGASFRPQPAGVVLRREA